MNQDAKFFHVLSWKMYVNIYFPEGIEHNMFIDIADPKFAAIYLCHVYVAKLQPLHTSENPSKAV